MDKYIGYANLLSSSNFDVSEILDLVELYKKSVLSQKSKVAFDIFQNFVRNINGVKSGLNILYLVLNEFGPDDRELFLNQFMEMLFPQENNACYLLLTFEVILRSDCIRYISEHCRDKLLDVIIQNISSVSKGFLACLVLSEFMNKIDRDKAIRIMEIIPKSIKSIDFKHYPQNYIFYQNLKDDIKLMIFGYNVNINEKDLFSIIIKCMESYNRETAMLLFDTLVDTKFFVKVWSIILPKLLNTANITRKHKNYYDMIFNVIIPISYSKTDMLSMDKRTELIKIIWDNDSLIKKIYNTVAIDSLLHKGFTDFLNSLNLYTNQTILDTLFEIYYKNIKTTTRCEMAIHKNVRLSKSLFKNMTNSDNLNKYSDILIKLYSKSRKYATYVFEQLNVLIENSNTAKKPIFDFLIVENINLYHCDDIIDESNQPYISLLKIVYTDLLHIISNDDTTDIVNLLVNAEQSLPQVSEFKATLKESIKIIRETLTSNENVSIRQPNNYMTCMKNMFVHLLSYLGLYMLSIPYCMDNTDLIKDLNLAALDMIRVADSDVRPDERSDEEGQWKLVFVDAMCILMEENDEFVKVLASRSFNKFIASNECNRETLKYLYQIVFRNNLNVADSTYDNDTDHEDRMSCDENEETNPMEVDEVNDDNNDSSADEIDGLILDSDVDLNETEEARRIRGEMIMTMQSLRRNPMRQTQPTDTIKMTYIEAYRDRCLDFYVSIFTDSPNFDLRMEALNHLLEATTLYDWMESKIKGLIEKFNKHLHVPNDYPVEKLCSLSMDLLEPIRNRIILSKPLIKAIIQVIDKFIRQRKPLAETLLSRLQDMNREYMDRAMFFNESIVSELIDHIPEFKFAWCQDIIDRLHGNPSSNQISFLLNALKKIIVDLVKKKDNNGENSIDEFMKKFTVKLVNLYSDSSYTGIELVSMFGCLNEILRYKRGKYYKLVTPDVHKKVRTLRNSLNRGTDRNLIARPILKKLKKCLNQFISFLDLAEKEFTRKAG